MSIAVRNTLTKATLRKEGFIVLNISDYRITLRENDGETGRGVFLLF